MKRRYNFIKSVFRANLKRPGFPYKVTLALTYRCNCRCRICGIWQRPQKPELSVEQIGQILRPLKGLGWLDVTGGEITLRQDLPEVLRVIGKSAEKLLILHLTTNGQLPDAALRLAEDASKLKAHTIINVSVDGPKQVHDCLRGVAGSYEKSLETFRLIKKIKRCHCYLSCTISEHNAGSLDGFISGLRMDLPDFSPGDLHFNLFHFSGHYYGNKGMGISGEIDPRRLERYLRLSDSGHYIKKILERKYMLGLRKYSSGNRHPLPCQALAGSCFIDPYGSVYPCGMYDRPIGNLKDHGYDLKELWQGQSRLDARMGIEKMECPGCWTPCEAYPAMLANVFKTMLF